MQRSMFDKKGVSAVVATVLIIMITVAAVGIVWAVVIPMIKDNVGNSLCDDVDISISTTQGFTCYDSTQKIVAVQVKKGSNEVNVSGVNFILSSAGNSYSENLSYNFATNEYHTFYVSSLTLGDIDEVSVAPVLQTGKVCGSMSLDFLPSCSGLRNVTTINDEYSPIFSNYIDNANSFLDLGTGIFNVTVLNTNGTVYLEINGTKILATNISNVYTASTAISSAGTYSYNWYSWGNGTAKNYNFSSNNNYIIGSAFAGGKGTTGDPFQVTSWIQLNSVRTRLDKNFILTTSLNSSSINYSGFGSNWEPIGNSTVGKFTGTFNGSGNTISDLIVNKLGINEVGLFGYSTGNVSNIGLINVNVTGLNATGGLAGYSAGTISNSYSIGNVTGSLNLIGGLVGRSAGTISNSYSIGNVTGLNAIGGLVGYQSAGTISNSYSIGNVTGLNAIGGLVGYQSAGTISNSYSIGNVTMAMSNNNGYAVTPYPQGGFSKLSGKYTTGANWTVNWWQYGNDPYNYGVYFITGGLSSQNIRTFMGVDLGGSRLYFGIYNGEVAYLPNVAPNTWNMFTVAHTSGGNVRLYKNGFLVKDNTSTRTDSINTSFMLCSSQTNWDRPTFPVDELGIWNTELTASQLLEIYNEGLGGQTYAVTPLYNFHFDEASGTKAVESISGANGTWGGTGPIRTDSTNKGGLAGYASGTITNSYWFNRSQGLSCYSGGNTGCTAKTIELYFKNYENTPMNLTLGTGWNFNTVWSINGNGSAYPKLKWQS